MALIEFVAVTLSESDSTRLWGRNLEFPKTASLAEGHTVEIIGWVLGRQSPAVAVEVSAEGRLIQRVPVNIQRSDVAALYPQAGEGERQRLRQCGHPGAAGDR
jgi:hypothetical protein